MFLIFTHAHYRLHIMYSANINFFKAFSRQKILQSNIIKVSVSFIYSSILSESFMKFLYPSHLTRPYLSIYLFTSMTPLTFEYRFRSRIDQYPDSSSDIQDLIAPRMIQYLSFHRETSKRLTTMEFAVRGVFLP